VGAPTPRETSATSRRDEPPAGRLDDLVARIPEGTQKSLHDLLRAKFTRVRRLRDGELR
jgi:hypothetical protein